MFHLISIKKYIYSLLGHFDAIQRDSPPFTTPFVLIADIDKAVIVVTAVVVKIYEKYQEVFESNNLICEKCH